MIMKVIFLDIDGVLNNSEFIRNNHDDVVKLYKYNKDKINDVEFLINRQMMDIDNDKLDLLRGCIEEISDVVVVITSSWKKLKIFPHIITRLRNLGIPVIGYTIDNGNDRGMGIRKYLLEHNVSDFVILDDDVFTDYDEELLKKLIKTSFFGDGFSEKESKELKKRLKK